MKRLLSASFIEALSKGKLLEYVKRDNTLDIEIRENYINIYYRGGNALKVTEISDKKYSYHFDKEYLKVATFLSEETINSFKTELDWNNYFPIVKQAMDFYFSRYSKAEREYQQIVVRENNYSSIANSTDYFIVDIEYDNRKNARFDIVAIEWLSDSSIRKLKKGHKPKLVVIEMKYGDGAFKGSAGISKHITDFNNFISNSQTVSEFKEEMLRAFRQKRQLELIPCLSGTGNIIDLTKFADEIEMMFLIANHDPASSILRTQLINLGNQNIKFLASNFTGFGLFKENVFDYPEFMKHFQSQI